MINSAIKRFIWTLGVWWLVALSGLPQAGRAQEQDRPLPDLKEFVNESRKKLRYDRALLSQYTFREKNTERQLDKNGRVTKTKIEVADIFPSPGPEGTYVRVVEKDGKPVPQNELDKQDREREELRRKYSDERRRNARLAKEAEERRKQEETIDEILLAFDISMLGRDAVDGHPTIVLDLKPRRNYKPKTSDAKVFPKIAARVWIHETEHEMVKFEATVIDDIKLGLGLLGRLDKGSGLTGERRKINDEIWLPAIFRAKALGRILLLKGVRAEYISEYSDYQKFSVDVKISTP